MVRKSEPHIARTNTYTDRQTTTTTSKATLQPVLRSIDEGQLLVDAGQFVVQLFSQLFGSSQRASTGYIAVLRWIRATL